MGPLPRNEVGRIAQHVRNGKGRKERKLKHDKTDVLGCEDGLYWRQLASRENLVRNNGKLNELTILHL